jgi:aspartyl-tRNA(Asn)/glutamyl-tRNA(Gln) amidotransferase subunit B
MSAKYRPTIGIECHVQLRTKTKLFSGAGNDARTAKPNTLINHIDFGLPGALPVFNREAMHLAIRAALALGVEPQLFSTFDRKHYFYPDLPMGYQITQYDQPVILGGKVEYILNGELKTVAITRAHLEADAGKSSHPSAKAYSLVDLNRAGTPLLEIVSEPQMHSAAEARAYAKELYLLMCYAGVTDGDLYHGNMRFDVNVSLSENDQLGVRSETKNLNSFRAVEKAVAYEIKRQSDLLDRGQSVVQETRGWNEAKQKTLSQRSKENADDYRYMPDPDLPPLEIDPAFIKKVRSEMPNLPSFWRNELSSLGLSLSQSEILLEAGIDFTNANYMDLLMDFKHSGLNTKMLVNWLVNVDIPLVRTDSSLINANRRELYKEVIELVEAGKLSSTNTKELIAAALKSSEAAKDLANYASRAGLLQQSDSSELEAIIQEVLAYNEAAVKDVAAGQDKAIGFLIGQVMAKTSGRANPEVARQIIKRLIEQD